jgi:beta-glucosidase
MKAKGSYLSKDLPTEQRIENLLAQMTLEEKVSQLKAKWFSWSTPFAELFEDMTETEAVRLKELLRNLMVSESEAFNTVIARMWKKRWKEIATEGDRAVGQLSCALRCLSARDGAELSNQIQKYVTENTRLKIPVMIHEESLHGCMAKGSTSFPQAIALASSWNPELMLEVATAIGKETKARGIGHVLSPTVNIARDPRCGRTEETYGEDPYLASKMAVSYVQGVQSQGVVTTPKHFVANFVGDGGRDSYEVHFSERILREIYLPAFKASIKEAGALSVMSAYNSLNGQPCSSHRWLLTDLLRGEWGFEGTVVSDYSSVVHIRDKHRTAGSKAEAAVKALEAGLDLELPQSDCFEEVLESVKKGLLSEKVVDEALRRILRLKFWAGLFDDPYVDPDEAERINDCEQHRNLALRAAREGIVLLKNSGILPLEKRIGSIAVIGPNANVARLGGYSTYGIEVVTPLDGIRAKVSADTQVRFAQGCPLVGGSRESISAAARTAERSDAAILVVGNSVPETEGENRDRSSLDLPGLQEDLICAISATGVPTVVVLIGGSAVTMERWVDDVDAVIEAWYPGEEGGTAIAEILFGDRNPSGKLPLTFTKRTGQLPLYYNHKPSGRTDDYVDLRGEQPLFPFGHGLSYTQFEYSNLKMNPEEVSRDSELTVSLDVKNTGDREGDEVVQLYLRDEVASLSRPVMELKRFLRITLKPGETRRLEFALRTDELAFLGSDLKPAIEAGTFRITVGSSSKDIRLEGCFEVK